ncbi:2OG-Fe(II) oxygenase [Novispirillum itersonii]|uniref:2OG-Fe(II) oxygenase n=1 Tax=Novispirillum itersonii TaxID=189 RepID=UPI00036A508A|nr:2OG-Fe(II) oxygenase [Novispirillum itersonii]
MKRTLQTEGIPRAVLLRFQQDLARRAGEQPDSADRAWRRAETARAAGDLDGAAEAYRACLALAPDRLPARRRLAVLQGHGLADHPDPADDRPAPFFLSRSVLSAAQMAALWGIVTARQDELEPSRMARNGEPRLLDTAYRQSLRMSGQGARALLLPIVRDVIARHDLLRRFGLSPLTSDRVEVEIASHSDGHFLRVHRDRGDGAPDRALTFVFYFFQLPQCFSGGDLLLHDTAADGEPRLLQATRLVVEHNSLVIFPADCWHQVLPVAGADADPLKGRWTVHGWFHA